MDVVPHPQFFADKVFALDIFLVVMLVLLVVTIFRKTQR